MRPLRGLDLVALAVAAVLIGPPAGQTQPAPTAPAAPPAPAAKTDSQCFYGRDVNGFSAPDDHTLYVRVGVKAVYRFDLMSDCLNLTYRQSVALESGPGGDWICSPLDATVVYRDTGMPERCPVTAIHRLTDDELKALPKRDRP